MKKRLRAVFITSIPFWAGGERWIIDVCSFLKRRGHEVTLICQPQSPVSDECLRLNIIRKELKMRADFGLISSIKLQRFLRKVRADVICVNMGKELRIAWFALLLDRLFGDGRRPVLIHRKAVPGSIKDKFINRLIYNSRVDGIVVNSRYVYEGIKMTRWLDLSKVSIIHNGIDMDRFASAPDSQIREKLGISRSSFVISVVGRLIRWKNVDKVITAFSSIVKEDSSAALLIAGTGEEEERLKSRALSLNLENSVFFLGFRKDVEKVYAASDLVIVFSRRESFGYATAEAMGAGIPVVCSDSGSNRELVVDGVTGLVIPQDDIKGLIRAVLFLMKNRKIAREMGKRGRERVMRYFTAQKMAREYESLFYRMNEGG